MTVILKDNEARTVSRLLDRFDNAMEAEYNSGEPDARRWSHELKKRAGPPREPIEDWVKRKFDPENEHQLETLVDDVIAAIETYEPNSDHGP